VSEKEIANVTEESFAVGVAARCDYLVKLAGRGAFIITQLKY
jgi:FtsP/CotA-like multicopper oxidase with cupredoxin domain